MNDSLPSNVRGSGHLTSEPAQRLRSLMNEVESIKQEANKLEEELKNKTFDDMKNKFMSALAADGAINEEALSVESLGEAYGPIQKRIRDLITRIDEDLMTKVQVAYSDFSELKNNSGKGNERDEFLTSLAEAHDHFEEITKNLEEGTNFYNDITKLLINLQNKVNDFCFARKTEREELVDYLSKGVPPAATPTSSANRSSTAPPAPPASTAPASTNNQPPYNLPFSQPQAGAPQYPNQPYPNPYQMYYPPPMPYYVHGKNS